MFISQKGGFVNSFFRSRRAVEDAGPYGKNFFSPP